MNTRETQQRRTEIYRLHLMGASQDDIASSLHIDKAAVSRHIAAVRASGSWTGRNHRQLYTDIMQESCDAARLSMSKAWKMYEDAESPGDRTMALGRVQAGIKLVLDMRPDLEALWTQEALDFVRSRQDEALAMRERVEQLELERALEKRVLPVSPNSS